MKIFDYFRKIHNLKIVITERERKYAARERLNLIKSHEKAMKIQAESLKNQIEKEFNRKIDIKNDEINNLKKLINHLKSSYENLHSLSGEFAIEFRTAALLAGKSQNRFANIEDRALREAERIERKIGKFINSEDV